MKNLLVISNDKIFYSKTKISSQFNDTINILEALQKKFKIFLLSRNDYIKHNFKLSRKKISRLSFKNIFFLKKKRFKVFIISITPFNLFYYLVLKILFKNISGFVLLRSDGFREYKVKFGRFGYVFFSMMMKVIIKHIKVISVNKKIKSYRTDYLIFPSELDKDWFKKNNKLKYSLLKLLYFGRYKKEKGIFFLIELLKNQDLKFQLTVAGSKSYNSRDTQNVKYIGELHDKKDIIKLYDDHQIFILPSYTEGSPKVILESLARKKPVIVFNEIKHVKSNFNGIFVCKRNIKDLNNMVNYIIKNYSKIINNMTKNQLPTKKDFQKNLLNIVNV